MRWFSYSFPTLPVGEQAGLYVDRAAAVSYIEQVRSRMLTGRRSPAKMDGGQIVDSMLTIKLRTLMNRCTNLAVSRYDPHGPGEYGIVVELAERSLVAELDQSRRARAGEVELEDLGRGLFRAAVGYEVDAILLGSTCKDFRVNNAGRLGSYPVRCKHLFAAQARLGLPRGTHGRAELNTGTVSGDCA